MSYFNGYFYGDIYSIISTPGTHFIREHRIFIAVASKETNALVAKYRTACQSDIDYIFIDSFGFMALSCQQYVVLYNTANIGTDLKLKLETSDISYFTAVDASGRFIPIGGEAIDIYY